jgi:hypothetical protein
MANLFNMVKILIEFFSYEQEFSRNTEVFKTETVTNQKKSKWKKDTRYFNKIFKKKK